MTDDGSIYRPPTADLTMPEQLPEKYLKGPLSGKKLTSIALVSLVAFLLEFPTIAVSFLSEFYNSEIYDSLYMVLTIISSLLFVYLLAMFRVFVNLRFNCSRVNVHVVILIVLSLLMAIDSLLIGDEFDLAMIAYFVLLVLFGIVNILFGKRLLAIKEGYSYLRLYSWSTIIAGLFMATVILFVLALPAALVTSFAFMMIFFTAAREKKVEAD
jgi:hypothetical protein